MEDDFSDVYVGGLTSLSNNSIRLQPGVKFEDGEGELLDAFDGVLKFIEPDVYSSFDGLATIEVINDRLQTTGDKTNVLEFLRKIGRAFRGPQRDVPMGASDPITYEDIKNGDKLVDFENEYKYGRYYLKSTFPLLQGKNPFTKRKIGKTTDYTAKLVSGGKRRRKTRKNRNSKRTKTQKRK